MDFLSSRSIFSTIIRSSDFDGFWCICAVREVHIARSARSRIFGFWGLEKSENFCEKMIFAKIIFFFVGSFWVEILRLAHSFGLWGCLGHSKCRQFDENPMDLTRIPMELGKILFILMISELLPDTHIKSFYTSSQVLAIGFSCAIAQINGKQKLCRTKNISRWNKIRNLFFEHFSQQHLVFLMDFVAISRISGKCSENVKDLEKNTRKLIFGFFFRVEIFFVPHNF